jgi:hypothetical protein
VDADAHEHVAAGERALQLGGGLDCVVRALEDDEERVALRVDLTSVVRAERLAQPRAVRGERGGVRVLENAGKPRRPFDVREEKGDSPPGQLSLRRQAPPRSRATSSASSTERRSIT